MSANMPAILFLSSTHKGDVMLEAAKSAGCRVLLMTDESQRHETWPYDVIDEFYVTPDFRRYQDVINTVTYLARGRKIDLILPLDEFEVELVAILREHMRIHGMGVSQMRRFRDKLTMRQLAQAAKIPVPRFSRILNYDELRVFFSQVQPPYIFKPRMEAGAMGIAKLTDSEQVWRKLDELGDTQSYYLIEEFIAGDVFHVDSIVSNGKIVFASAQQYGKPPLDTYQGGGIFETRTLSPHDPRLNQLLDINQGVIKTLGLANGVTHAEFIHAHKDSTFYFLEIAARVGGAYISDMIEHATGINLWREWLHVELAVFHGKKYKLPKTKAQHGAILLTLAKQQHPDMSAYQDAEIAQYIHKPYHAGVILTSPDADRITTLLADYRERFKHDFMAVAAPMGVQRTGVSG